MAEPITQRVTVAQTRKPRVMIVDDDDDTAELLAMPLRARGYDVKTAQEALDATLLAAEFRPQIAIIDLRLPGMSGHELVTWLRTHPGLSTTIFIAITGCKGQSLANISVEVGFHFHLLKPVDMPSLLKMIEGELPDQEGISHA